MNGRACCILGVCCPPGSTQQIDALAREMVEDGACAEIIESVKIAKWLYTHFDLAPAGTVTPLLQAGARLGK